MKTATILTSLAASLLVCSIAYTPFCASALTDTDARSTIEQARSKLIECYNATLGAEKAGANISSLLGNLSDAGSLLSKADLALGQADFDSAAFYANQSRAKLEAFVEAADLLRTEAEQDRLRDFMINIVGSIIGAVIVAIGGIGVWIFLTSKCGKPGSASG